MILLLIVLFVLCVVAIVIGVKFMESDSLTQLFTVGGSILFIGMIAMAVIVSVGSYYDDKNAIRNYYITKETIAEARKNPLDGVERAALTTKIIEINEWLQTIKHDNTTFGGGFATPDEVEEMGYLK